jgi:hypothetical protein
MKSRFILTEFTDPGGSAPNPPRVFHNGLGGGIGKIRGFHRKEVLSSECQVLSERRRSVRYIGEVIGQGGVFPGKAAWMPDGEGAGRRKRQKPRPANERGYWKAESRKKRGTVQAVVS